MKKACFIVPYFGQLPNYFQLFLNSCANNLNYEWLIFTDCTQQYIYPKNVKKISMSFSDLRKLIQLKFDFPISLVTPKKLCDYKPAFGYIFENYIKGYKYWGHCDIDVIMGNLDNFLPPLFARDYDKIFTLGHFILYKNNFDNNRRFMKSYKGVSLFKKSFTTNNITVFDENYHNDDNVNSIFLNDGVSVFQNDFSFNVKVTPTKFTRVTYNSKSKKTITHVMPGKILIVHTEKGLFEFYIKNSKLEKKEFMYIHLQQRMMRLNMDMHQIVCNFAIIPNGFYQLKDAPKNISEFKMLKKKTLNIHRIRLILKWRLLRIKKLLQNLK
ncbi:hypothetical protein PS395_02840 [Limosilactobacillus pontis]|uniref:DUF6625 family protein n=1 Tax=Limosilactobacillus pontis TaxID=35787 RepID=UPI002F26B176